MVERERLILAFETAGELAAWLETHHQSATDLWVRIFKAWVGKPSVTWVDCVIESLRFGWIDAQKLPFDETSFLQRLTPRKPKSSWSIKNRQHAETLIGEGRMTPTGLAHVNAAKADGRWQNAYAGSATMTIPDDFLAALEIRPAAKAFFGSLNRQNLYSIYYRLHTAKRPKTWARRLALILDQLDRGDTWR